MSKRRDGFVYAIQPQGMNLVKVGCTNNPAERAAVLASFSPVPMVFRHVLQVSSFYAATAFEQYVLGWSRDGGGFGEWRSDLDLVDDLFQAIAPAVDVTSDYPVPTKPPVVGSRQTVLELNRRLLVAEFHGSFPGGDDEARQAVGMSVYDRLITAKYRATAFDWLAANRPDVAEQFRGAV